MHASAKLTTYDSITLPRSTTHFGVNCLGLATYLAAIAFAYANDQHISTVDIFAVMLAAAAPSALYAWLKIRQQPLPRPQETLAQQLPRLLTKLIGIFGCVTFITLIYWLFPEYNKAFYLPFWDMISHYAPWIALITPYYIYLTDKHMPQPEDGAWHCGRILTGHRHSANLTLALRYLQGWLIKGFFLPLMTIYLSFNSNDLMQLSLGNWNTATLYAHANTLFFTIDLVFAATGYLMTLRLLDTHIQSSEPNLLGWMVCLLCYNPFWEQLTQASYLNYDDSISWLNYVDAYPIVGAVWCGLIIACLIIYAASTVAFGIRFSNLTYRGLISNGTYRYSKHPAYISKNISWWLIAIPFISDTGDTPTAIRNCVLLLGVNTVYFLRARTEERHLSAYPEYVAYAQWINDHGILRFLGKRFPSLRYQYRGSSLTPIAAIAPASKDTTIC
jgi:protein-S-isoprenylcysteine O-methyltransferase Ste14